MLNRLTLLFSLAAFLAPWQHLAAIEPAGGAIEIRFLSEAEVGSGLVRLADLAEVRAAEPAVRARLAATELFPAPATASEIEAQRVREVLTLAGWDMARIRCSGASRIALQPGERREAVEHAEAGAVESQIESVVLASLQQEVDARSTWRVTPRLSREQAEYCAGAEEITLVAAPAGEGLVQAEFTVRRAGGSETVQLPVHISRTRKVVTAVRDLPAGTILSAADIRYADFQESPRSGVLFESNEALGRELTRNISAGSPLDSRAIRQPLLIARGDVVNVFSRIGGVQVRTDGRAMNEGARNDVITVQLLRYKEKLQARVIGYRECEVFAAGPVAGQ